MTDTTRILYKLAFKLSILTIIYNLAEGFVGVYFGYSGESLTLFGFGADSFIEVISGIGIAYMVSRIQQHPQSGRSKLEKTALTVTGLSFYALVLGLLATSVYNLLTGQKPETTLAGVILSLISIIIMLVLMSTKMKVGKALNSDPIIADARCTKVCVYMSVVLLIASAAYELTKVAYIDIAGTLALAYLSFNEGRECFEKVKRNKLCECENG